jgi:hypothetical protein
VVSYFCFFAFELRTTSQVVKHRARTKASNTYQGKVKVTRSIAYLHLLKLSFCLVFGGFSLAYAKLSYSFSFFLLTADLPAIVAYSLELGNLLGILTYF